MADHEQEESPKKPPKIKLGQTNGNGLPSPKVPSEGIQKAADGNPLEDTARISLGDEAESSGGLKPPKGSLRPKEDTTRIDLPSGPTPAAKLPGKSQTARLDLSAAKPPKPEAPGSDTARIDLKSAKPQKPDTARIDLSQTYVDAPSRSETQPVAPAAGSADTAKIDLTTADAPPHQAETKPYPPDESSEAPTRGIAQLTDNEREEILKQSTIRVEADGAAEEGTDFSPSTSGIPVQDQVDEERDRILKQSTMRVELEGIHPPDAPMSATKNKTMRVELDQEEVKGKSQTARIELPPEDAPASARINVDEKNGSDDVFRRHATSAATPLAGAAAGAAAETDALPKKSETARTSVEPVAPLTPTPDAEAGKSKTARIEMPADVVNAQAGRPKTIKIKRAETPPMRATAAPKAGVKRSGRGKSAAAADDSEIGAIYGVLAIASVIAISVLLYVLAAQTIVPSLPFMGKIG